MKSVKTAEAVSKGHPDKICDQISDAILDECLRQDSESRVAIETVGGHGLILITGELTTKAQVDVQKITKKIYKDCGYFDEIGVLTNIVSQSPDIAQGVDAGGAGDQGIMVGFACDQNKALIPQELFLAREILANLPKNFGPDAKCQVTLDENNIVDTIVLSAQHKPKASFAPLKNLVKSYKPKNFFINPTGQFVLGGFAADTGLTGRKLAVDNYGPQVSIGGGCFSGKDPTKVDRSAAYMARRIAVDLLKKHKAKEVIVKLAYSIGVAQPVMATAQIDGRSIEIKGYDLTPSGIIHYLDLKKPIYYRTAQNGHFGHGFKWDG